MKQVIFVGSTSYSGSTFLDLTLAHDKAGFSCGEVMALFYPTRPHHINPNCAAFPTCKCSNKTCKVWQKLNAYGYENLYQSIFDQFSEVNFIVDSSKDPFWIAEQCERLSKTNIAVKNIAIWKTPLEIAASFAKRDEESKWERSWVNYYRNYDTLLDGKWRSVRYRDFVKDPETLQRLCSALDIPYFSGKAEYWKKHPYHTLFGNHSARIHLNENIENYAGHDKEKEELAADSSHRSIYYRETSDDNLAGRVEQRIRKSRYIRPINELLKERDIGNSNGSHAAKSELIKRNSASLFVRKCKRFAVSTTCRFTLQRN